MRSFSTLASRLVPVILLASTAVLSGQKSALPVDPAGPPRGTESELRDLVDRYSDDRQALLRRYPVDLSPERTARLKKYYADWQARVASIDFEPLGVEVRIDHIVLRRRIAAELRLIEREEQWQSETTELLPFANTILALNDARMRMEPLDPEKAAATLDKLAEQIDLTRRGVEATTNRPAGAGATNGTNGSNGTNGPNGARQDRAGERGGDPVAPIKTTKLVAFRAQGSLARLTTVLRGWFDYDQGYDDGASRADSRASPPAVHERAVKGEKMTNRQFHDTIIQGGNLPVEMVRARLMQQKLPRDYDASWKYAGEIKP
jgi:hypothetical protein